MSYSQPYISSKTTSHFVYFSYFGHKLTFFIYSCVFVHVSSGQKCNRTLLFISCHDNNIIEKRKKKGDRII